MNGLAPRYCKCSSSNEVVFFLITGLSARRHLPEPGKSTPATRSFTAAERKVIPATVKITLATLEITDTALEITASALKITLAALGITDTARKITLATLEVIATPLKITRTTLEITAAALKTPSTMLETGRVEVEGHPHKKRRPSAPDYLLPASCFSPYLHNSFFQTLA
jgi:hypothetical protein